MAKKRLLQARPFLALGILAGAWLYFPFIIKVLTRVSFYEFQAPAQVAASFTRDLQGYWGTRLHSKDDLITAGRDLARLNGRLEQTIHENVALHGELVRLEGLLNLPAREGYRYEIARVVRRDFSGWWQQIIIRKGSNYGIRGGEAVIFVGGVVGRVREGQVGAYTAVVDLVSSPNVRLAANVEGDNRPVSFQGGPSPSFASPRGSVEFVPADIETDPARLPVLVTSGLGGVFPPGIPIGRIERLVTAPDGQFQEGEVLLDSRLASLTEVAVLVRAQSL